LILNGQASEAIKWHCKHYTGRGTSSLSVESAWRFRANVVAVVDSEQV
jgi:hypothetical protein